MIKRIIMKSSVKLISVIILMIAGAFARLIPHVPNFTPTESLAIFGGAYLGYKYLSYILPTIMIYASDLVINNTLARSFYPDVQGIVWWDNYMFYTIGAVVAIVFISRLLLKKINTKNVIITVLVSSILFFLVTNFAAWATVKSLYPANFSGLMMSYAAGIPFYKVSLFGNLIFSGVLFGSMALINYKLNSTDKAVA